jgi:ribonucleoside-diphosphate reductase alpha chain
MERGIAESVPREVGWRSGWQLDSGQGHRQYINGTNGESQGVIPFSRSITICWWLSIRAARGAAVAVLTGNLAQRYQDFLDLRVNTGDERRRAHDMNTADWVRTFYEANGGSRQVDTVPQQRRSDLHEIYGKQFEDRYVRYEVAEGDLGRDHGGDRPLEADARHSLKPGTLGSTTKTLQCAEPRDTLG